LGAGWEALKQNTEEQQKSKTTFSTVLRDLATDLATFKRDITRQKDQVSKKIQKNIRNQNND
jgi:hypothetical protein